MVENPEDKFSHVETHGNFCDPVLFCFFLLIILKLKRCEFI